VLVLRDSGLCGGTRVAQYTLRTPVTAVSAHTMESSTVHGIRVEPRARLNRPRSWHGRAVSWRAPLAGPNVLGPVLVLRAD
jgi:hypothetical protein